MGVIVYFSVIILALLVWYVMGVCHAYQDPDDDLEEYTLGTGPLIVLVFAWPIMCIGGLLVGPFYLARYFGKRRQEKA